MIQHEFLFQQLDQARDDGLLEMTSFAGVRIAREHGEGLTVSGVAAETLPYGLQVLCVEAMERYRTATGQEPSWLFINSSEEKIVVH